jgi:hypothetical protein
VLSSTDLAAQPSTCRGVTTTCGPHVERGGLSSPPLGTEPGSRTSRRLRKGA